MKSLIIDTDTLESACKRIIEKLRDHQISWVEIPQDMYWHLSSEQAYSVTSDFKPELLGSLRDDWMELKKVASGSHITTFVDFDRLAAILKAVSQELNPE